MMDGWTMGLEAWLWMAAWSGVLMLMVWMLVREPRRSERDEAVESLRGRLARGEISRDEFEQALHLLDATRH